MKVIVMTLSPLTERWAGYFCTDTLYDEFDFEYWDCSHVAFPAFAAVHPLERPYAVSILNQEMLKQRLEALPKDTLLLSDVHFTDENRSFHRLVGKYISNCIYFDIWSYSLGTFSLTQTDAEIIPQPTNIFTKFKHAIYQCEYIRLISKYIRYKGDERFKREYQLYLMRQIEREEYRVWYNCRKQYKYYLEFSCNHHKQYIINHPDVEKYLCLQNAPSIRNDRYIVYMDQYYPLHPDLEEAESEINHAEVAVSFYRSVNKFFAEIERQMNCKVLVAAHPVADYSTNPFDGREIVYYKTAELVKDSIGVCLHYSSAANFMALYDKPVVVFECDATRQSPIFTKHIHHIAGILNIPVLDIDKSCENMKAAFQPMDRDRRKVFMDAFCDINNRKLNKDLFPIHLKAIYNMIQKTEN